MDLRYTGALGHYIPSIKQMYIYIFYPSQKTIALEANKEQPSH